MENTDWYTKLSKLMNPVFSKEQFKQYIKRHRKKLPFYKKFIKGRKILDIGCGFGYSSVSLSYLGYDVVALDKDGEVINIIKKNAKNFGKNMKIVKGDLFEIDKIFKPDSFDASISGGLLEHFNIRDIRRIVKKQLLFAPIVIADMPICSKKSYLKKYYRNFSKRICKDGIYRNLWSEDYWVKHVLQDFNVIYSKVSRSSKHTGRFEKLTLVISRRN
jgi:2-polyprenyl-3-methyl-5-hydroxy-6-metoxy-1,4-benzoquinol methylase